MVSLHLTFSYSLLAALVILWVILLLLQQQCWAVLPPGQFVVQILSYEHHAVQEYCDLRSGG